MNEIKGIDGGDPHFRTGRVNELMGPNFAIPNVNDMIHEFVTAFYNNPRYRESNQKIVGKMLKLVE